MFPLPRQQEWLLDNSLPLLKITLMMGKYYQMGHQITGDVLNDLKSWLANIEL